METTRRTIAKGAAWAVPTVALGAAAAPANASSPAPGLQGWIFWSKDCSSDTLKITKTPSGSSTELWPNGDYGFYIFNATAKQVSGACVTFSYPASLGTLNWTAMSDNGSWSKPVAVKATSSRVTTYQMCYQGTWQDSPASRGIPAYTAATSYPSFRATTNNFSACQSPITVNILRTVSINGAPVTFTRDSTF